MLEPQDLPGRYGRVVNAIDRVLAAVNSPAALAGGWAVWRHGYVGPVTQDIDIVLPAGQLEEFLRVAGVAGFEVLTVPEGRWPKLQHKDTGIQVHILPEGARPGTTSRPAPTTIPHPDAIGGQRGHLGYVSLPALVELKLAAGRARDEGDVVELLRANPGEVAQIQDHVEQKHSSYGKAFRRLLERAQEQDAR